MSESFGQLLERDRLRDERHNCQWKRAIRDIREWRKSPKTKRVDLVGTTGGPIEGRAIDWTRLDEILDRVL